MNHEQTNIENFVESLFTEEWNTCYAPPSLQPAATSPVSNTDANPAEPEAVPNSGSGPNELLQGEFLLLLKKLGLFSRLTTIVADGLHVAEHETMYRAINIHGLEIGALQECLDRFIRDGKMTAYFLPELSELNDKFKSML